MQASWPLWRTASTWCSSARRRGGGASRRRPSAGGRPRRRTGRCARASSSTPARRTATALRKPAAGSIRFVALLRLFRFAFSSHSHRPGVCRRREGEGEGVETKGPTFGKCLPSSIIHVFVRTWAPPILYPVADPLPTILGTLNTLLSFILAQRTAILLRFCSSTFLLFVSFRSIFVRMHSASRLHYSILI